MDPLNWLSQIAPDRQAPTAYSFKSYPQRGKGVFQNSTDSKIYTFGTNRYRAWGVSWLWYMGLRPHGLRLQ